VCRDDEGTRLRLNRRYWGDEMSSCIEIYCLHLLNSPSYLDCLQNYCPDAVVSVLPKRQVPDDETAPLDSAVGQGEIQGQFVACPDHQGSKYCVGFVCHEITSGIVSLDVATSRCALLNCADVEMDYERCVVSLCC